MLYSITKENGKIDLMRSFQEINWSIISKKNLKRLNFYHLSNGRLQKSNSIRERQTFLSGSATMDGNFSII